MTLRKTRPLGHSRWRLFVDDLYWRSILVLFRAKFVLAPATLCLQRGMQRRYLLVNCQILESLNLTCSPLHISSIPSYGFSYKCLVISHHSISSLLLPHLHLGCFFQPHTVPMAQAFTALNLLRLGGYFDMLDNFSGTFFNGVNCWHFGRSGVCVLRHWVRDLLVLGVHLGTVAGSEGVFCSFLAPNSSSRGSHHCIRNILVGYRALSIKLRNFLDVVGLVVQV